MSFIPKVLLKPLAKALVTIFYMMVNQSADTQNSAEWRFDHYDANAVPFGYKARLKLDLFKDTSEIVPKRRASDREPIRESDEAKSYE